MNFAFIELAERFRGEVPELERAIQRALGSWAQLRRLPQDDAYVDSVALNLHSFYSGLERLFELTVRQVDRVVPSGETWHRDLLQRMIIELPSVRPALLSPDNAAKLDEFRRFRHLVRHVYTMNLTPDKMVGLILNLPELWPKLRSELLAFADFLEELGQVN